MGDELLQPLPGVGDVQGARGSLLCIDEREALRAVQDELHSRAAIGTGLGEGEGPLLPVLFEGRDDGAFGLRARVLAHGERSEGLVLGGLHPEASQEGTADLALPPEVEAREHDIFGEENQDLLQVREYFSKN